MDYLLGRQDLASQLVRLARLVRTFQIAQQCQKCRLFRPFLVCLDNVIKMIYLRKTLQINNDWFSVKYDYQVGQAILVGHLCHLFRPRRPFRLCRLVPQDLLRLQ
jgi:hypothetical protein